MKLSRFNYIIKDKEKNILFNTFSKQYVAYDNNYHDKMENILNLVKDNKVQNENIELTKELISKGLIIDDSINELDKIKFNELKHLFQDEVFYLTIQPTLNCNFGCTYCYEKRRNERMDNEAVNKTINLVKKLTKHVKKLEVIWYGGEPSLEMDTIKLLTNEFKKICKENCCKYKAVMVSNGYLLTENILDELINLSVELVQITIDGTKEYHNSQRPLNSGVGTFDVVINNLITALDKGLKITFRINVSNENFSSVEELFDIIPLQYRKNVNMSICNVFQNNPKINLFTLYKKAIDKGYGYFNKDLKVSKCQSCCKNSITIEPNGNLAMCSPLSEIGKGKGKISNDGDLILFDKALYYNLMAQSVTSNDLCNKCTLLPMCMGGCRYKKITSPSKCTGKDVDGMSIEERIFLIYYNDISNGVFNEVSIT
jgi:uncharacterized protein